MTMISKNLPRVCVASARLPIVLTHRGDDWVASPSPGGLATALRSVADQQPLDWVGLPGHHVPESDREIVADRLLRNGCRPIFASRAELEGFYEGFSNGVLWPLFHGLSGRSHFDLAGWKSYQAVNERFADAISAVVAPGDRIWVHDYQLALLPELLRKRRVECPIGFFLHIPFPSAEEFRKLPLREEILRGLLGADLVAFHTYEYASQFLNSCVRVLGLECDPESVRLPERDVVVTALPIGIEPGEIRQMLASPAVGRELGELIRTYAGKRIVIGVDRLDYTKGIPEKLRAFEELLRTRPEWRGRVVLIQIGAPTRSGVDEYKELRREVEELVGRINGRYGSASFAPVVYVAQNLPRERLAALYRAADVAMVTPLRDGMNLVALEYVLACEGRGGALLLSEFAGAAHWLAGARLVNPYSISATADVLASSLAEPADAADRYAQMLRFAEENTSARWANAFLERLASAWDAAPSRPDQLAVRQPALAERIRGAKRPLVVLDYDGTLRDFELDPDAATPDAGLRELLAKLAEVAVVYLVSGRTASTLDRWFGDVCVGLACEHGLSVKRPNGSWEKRARIDAARLRRTIAPMLEEFVRRTPGSRLEVKRSSLAWHYRGADREFGSLQARLLLSTLEGALRRRPYTVLRGARVIEVRHRSVTKARALSALLEWHHDADLVFIAGDDATDDEMMAALTPAWRARSVTCSVGSPRRYADLWVGSSTALRAELTAFVELRRTRSHAVVNGSVPAVEGGGRARLVGQIAALPT